MTDGLRTRHGETPDREPTLWDDLANTNPCADYPDVRVCEAVALEIAFRKIVDDDEASDLVGVALHAGWRPTTDAQARHGSREP